MSRGGFLLSRENENGCDFESGDFLEIRDIANYIISTCNEKSSNTRFFFSNLDPFWSQQEIISNIPKENSFVTTAPIPTNEDSEPIPTICYTIYKTYIDTTIDRIIEKTSTFQQETAWFILVKGRFENGCYSLNCYLWPYRK